MINREMALNLASLSRESATSPTFARYIAGAAVSRALRQSLTDGEAVRVTAWLFDVSPRTVRRWRLVIEDFGIECWFEARSGRSTVVHQINNVVAA